MKQISYLHKFVSGAKNFYFYDEGQFKGFISNGIGLGISRPYISNGYDDDEELNCILEALIGEEIFP